MDNYHKWLGFAFERFCRKFHHIIAKILGFSAVQYTAGVFFNRATNQKDPGYQLDLVFARADQVYTICEIKYLQTPAGTNVINELERKVSLFPNPNNKTIHKVLICNTGVERAVLQRAYFDSIITSNELFAPTSYAK